MVTLGGVGMNKIYNIKIKIARKDYTCIRCKSKIEPKSEYAYIRTYIVNRKAYYDTTKSYRMCIKCIKDILDEFVRSKFGYPVFVSNGSKILEVKSVDELIDLAREYTVSFGLCSGFRIKP